MACRGGPRRTGGAAHGHRWRIARRNAVRSRWVLGPQRTAHNAHGGGKNGKNEPIDAPCLALDKASYAPGRGRVWLRSHYQRGGGGEWDKLAWFATTGWAAAVAAHVRSGGKAGDVIGIGAAKGGGNTADEPVQVA